MDYAKPAEVAAAMIDASEKKLAVGPRDLFICAAYEPKRAGSGVIPDDAAIVAK